ncbi:glycosyltransferase [Pseudonocardia sp. Ae505_Ps2]|uniref:glycosyltransferase n=1 Tax=Pseudonocardia sp. Ae505_Ps2 TaxID=1885034 RepID=UPI00094F38CF|nr:glycosyltransferase [Pseudonocardia sp. Ae505_Ps2]OLM09993.1 Glycosyl transferase, group 1 family protein [Pseudonocardia sp. Ae505_Ps2]
MKVLQVVNEMGTGGAERVVADLARHGTGLGWDTMVLSSGGVRADELAAQGYRTETMPLVRRTPVGILRGALAVAAALRRHRPDVVLAHNVLVGLVCRLAAHTRRRRPTLVTVFHGVAADDYPAAARLLSGAADVVVAVSAAVADRLRAAGLHDTRIAVLRNAVTPPVLPARADARRALGLPDDVGVALCAARLVPQKRHDVLLDAWRAVRGGPVLLLAGDGPLSAGLEERVADLGDRVRFLGARDDIPTLLAAADVAVLTSDWEGLPMVVLEAMAAGLPVVATDVDGVREALGPRADAPAAGLLVPPGDPAAVAAALNGLADPRRRGALAAAGRARVAAEHDPAALAADYDALLHDARAAGAGGPGRFWLAGVAALAGLATTAAVLLAVALGPVTQQASVTLVARPDVGATVSLDPARPVVSTSYGEVVSLALPALPEIVTGPSLLGRAAAAVPGGPDPEQLRRAVSVELVPASGLARISVRDPDPGRAEALAEAVVDQVVAADVLDPAGRLVPVDTRAAVTPVATSTTLAAALALLAGIVVAVVTGAALLPRRRATPHSGLLRAVAASGRGPVAVLDAADPVLVDRIRLLAGPDRTRVVPAGLGLETDARRITEALALRDGPVAGPARPGAVVALADPRRTRTEDLTGVLTAVPERDRVLAVVLT